MQNISLASCGHGACNITNLIIKKIAPQLPLLRSREICLNRTLPHFLDESSFYYILISANTMSVYSWKNFLTCVIFFFFNFQLIIDYS